MIQEHKELLLKDLCGRLPYGVKCQIKGEEDFEPLKLKSFIQGEKFYAFDFYIKENLSLSFKELGEFKPYLFPLSSMTEEQRTSHNFLKHSAYANPIKLIDWYNKNHFDFRGLIPKDLAINAFGLNIY